MGALQLPDATEPNTDGGGMKPPRTKPVPPPSRPLPPLAADALDWLLVHLPEPLALLAMEEDSQRRLGAPPTKVLIDQQVKLHFSALRVQHEPHRDCYYIVTLYHAGKPLGSRSVVDWRFSARLDAAAQTLGMHVLRTPRQGPGPLSERGRLR